MLFRKEIIDDGVLIAEIETLGEAGDYNVNIVKPNLTSWEMALVTEELEIFKAEIAKNLKLKSIVAFLSKDKIVPSNIEGALEKGYFKDILDESVIEYKNKSDVYNDAYELAKRALNKGHNMVLITDFYFSERRIEYIRKLSQEKLRVVSICNPFNGRYRKIELDDLEAEVIEEYIDHASENKLGAFKTDHSSLLYNGYSFEVITSYKNIRYVFSFDRRNDRYEFYRYYLDFISERQNNVLKQTVQSYDPIANASDLYTIKNNPVIFKNSSSWGVDEAIKGKGLIETLEVFFENVEDYHKLSTIDLRTLLKDKHLIEDFEDNPDHWLISNHTLYITRPQSDIAFSLYFKGNKNPIVHLFCLSENKDLKLSSRYRRSYMEVDLKRNGIDNKTASELIKFFYYDVLNNDAVRLLQNGKGLLVEHLKDGNMHLVGGDYKERIYEDNQSQWLMFEEMFKMQEIFKVNPFNIKVVASKPVRSVIVDDTYFLTVLSDVAAFLAYKKEG